RHRDGVGERHVELARGEGQYRRRQVLYDRILDAVEIRPAILPIIWVSCDLDRLVRLEFDEFKWTGTDWILAHIARRDVAGIDRRIPGSEQRKEGRLRPLQPKGNLVISSRGDIFEIPVPGLARVDAELCARLLSQHVPGTHDVLRREGFAIMPFDT